MRSRELLAADVSVLEGVSARSAKALRERLGIVSVRDLLEHYPSRYRDVGAVMALRDAPLGEPVTLMGVIDDWQVLRPRGKPGRKPLTIAKARLHADGGGRIDVPFFNQDWRTRRHPRGARVAVSGTLERYRQTVQLKNARLTELEEGLLGPSNEDQILATYPATEALSSARIAGFVRTALARLDELGWPDEFLPLALRRRHGLMGWSEAVRRIHRPADLAEIRPARERLVYDELLSLQIGLQQRRRRLEEDASGLAQAPVCGELAERLLRTLPFTPTDAQQRACRELGADLAREKPMHRLLQGDVGSGKTLVAAWMMLSALDAGRQAVLMAPTEVLAEQHLRTFTHLLAPLGVNAAGGPRVELLTGSTTMARQRRVLAETSSGEIGVLIGTHALLEERVMFADLGAVVVDEQHRFGVEHRARLRAKRRDGRLPDVLVMTATPIPRSLALTIYGDLDVTTLDELPPGRQPIVTRVIDSESPRRQRVYEFIRERVREDERAYVVCPLIEPSEALRVELADQHGDEHGDRSLASAEAMYEHLRTEVFADLRVAKVHGRLSSSEKELAMESFRSGAAPILVATTVIEVGLDVPEATVMVIEDADRFGISQLHQLRGRIGRGASASYCVLFSPVAEEVNARLEALARTADGFELAETDLELRGEGSLFDTRQSGLPDLKLTRLVRDRAWVQHARDDAGALVASDLELAHDPALAEEVARRYGEERLAELRTG
ncbi:MAG: ATP-dependent DNA helicase RecG [Egibacteraceae bacterium]